MPLIDIHSPDDARIEAYRHVPEPQLVRDRGLFVAEGRLVVRRLLAAWRFAVRSLLVTEAALESLRDLVEPRLGELTVYRATLDLLRQIVGYNIHRGCLALGVRGEDLSIDEVVRDARLLVVLEQITDADNVGGIFRTARAFGAGGALLDPGSCDPLYRKAIRVSIGAALQLPFARVRDWPAGLDAVREAGYTILALTPAAGADDIASLTQQAATAEQAARKLALLVGSEGTGLSDAALRFADRRVRIPMAPGVDSLNVATAAAIALHRLAPQPESG